jgi:hypothetical protein
MHLEHVATAEACTADLASWTGAPTPAPGDVDAAVAPQALPIPVPLVEPASVHALPFAFVVDVEGLKIVLATDVEEGWGHGDPRFLSSVTPDAINPSLVRDVAIERVPTAVLANVGRTVRVYSADGEACTARIGAPMLLGEIWGEYEEWSEETDEAPQPKAPSATAAWKESRRLLVAPLATDGECGTPLWARDVALPAPAVYIRAEGAVPRSARKAIMANAEVRDMAVDFRQHHEEYMRLDEGEPVPKLADDVHAQRWQDARGHELFTITFGPERSDCGAFDSAWAAFVPGQAAGSAGLTALDRAGDDVHAVFDLERDGKIEAIAWTWLGPTRLLEIGENGALSERASLADVPFFGCPC